jgi:hypothetical protein
LQNSSRGVLGQVQNAESRCFFFVWVIYVWLWCCRFHAAGDIDDEDYVAGGSFEVGLWSLWGLDGQQEVIALL